MDNLEILEEARQAYERVKNSPDMYEFAILLSCQYLILGDKELSRKYLEEFMSHNVKIYFYAACCISDTRMIYTVFYPKLTYCKY